MIGYYIALTTVTIGSSTMNLCFLPLRHIPKLDSEKETFFLWIVSPFHLSSLYLISPYRILTFTR